MESVSDGRSNGLEQAQIQLDSVQIELGFAAPAGVRVWLDSK
jgi:hypothetical protein